jgi:GNAT superfamily N-acetyltransferase
MNIVNSDMESLKIREALREDIPAIQVVRNLVRENRLTDPSLVTDVQVEDYITNRGKGWVAEINGSIIGFSIISVADKNVWALFLHPSFEAKGIGKSLHRIMMDWYFTQSKETVWLGTEPHSRAETFYRMQGWKEAGIHGKNEIKFEMSTDAWSSLQKKRIK